jgi:hypothetical protein
VVRAETVEYFAFLLLTTVLAGTLAFFWGLSPLGFGFAAGPSNPMIKKIAVVLIMATYFVGIPALLLGQVVSPILWFYGRKRSAYIVPLACMGSFLVGISAALFVFTEL